MNNYEVVVGEVHIPSDSCVEWKVSTSTLQLFLKDKDWHYFTSPLFVHNNEPLQIIGRVVLIMLPRRKWDATFNLEIYANIKFLTFVKHSTVAAGIKENDGYFYKLFKRDSRCERDYTLSYAKFKESLSVHRDAVTFFVEFRDRTVEYYPKLPNVAVEKTGISRTSNTRRADTDKVGLDAYFENLKDLFLNEEHCDVVFQVGSQQFKSHKLILSARSPVFKAMMTHDLTEKSDGVVNVNDCEPNIFREFLLYLYSWKVEVTSKEIAFGLYEVADTYNVGELKEHCVDYLKTHLSVDMFLDVIKLAKANDEAELYETSKEYFTKNAERILSMPSWQTFMKENTAVANELFLLTLRKK